MLDFRVADDPAGIHVFETLLDLLADVDVVLDVFERNVLRKVLEDLLNLLLGRIH